MPAFLELLLDQGTTFTRDITLTNDLNGLAINLVGYEVHCNARKSFYSHSKDRANADIVFITTLVDAPNGMIRLSQTAANTANYYPRRYMYDVLCIDSAGVRTRVLEGTLTVSPSVS